MSFSSSKLKKQFKLMIIFTILLVIGIGFLTEYVSDLFVFILIPYVIIVGNYFVSFKCPKCQKPVMYKYFDLFGAKIPICIPKIPNKCFSCGEPLE